LPELNPNFTLEEQTAYSKNHYLDNVDFNDDDLLFSDAFTNKLNEYLKYFKIPHLQKDLLDKDYMSVVDTILNKAKVNQLVYENISEYLINKFKEFGDNEVIAYIMDNYVIKDDLCIDDKLRNSVQRRINQSKRFKPGAEVPDIIIADSTGIAIDLRSLKSEKTLILFYASWCPHCQRLIPKLNNFYKSLDDRKFKILAISIDTSRTEWLNFVRKNNLNWINVSDMKGGSGKAVGDYYLYATPAMFLVNDKKEIIAVPTNLEEIKKYFN
jgi:peroxiredoxin